MSPRTLHHHLNVAAHTFTLLRRDETLNMSSPEAIAGAAALTARIKAFTTSQIEVEFPWMPKADLHKTVANMSTVLRRSLARQ